MRNLTGLPSTLGEAARAYLDGFPPGDVVAFPITALDRTGVPVWIVALFLDASIALEGAMPSGIGYGASDEDAILGALGEIAEAIAPTLALMRARKVSASYDDLVRVHGDRSVADPLTLGLPAGSPVGRGTVLDWIEGARANDGATVLIPIDVAACDTFELSPGYVPFTTLITNGLGAGPDLDWAIGHGLLEVLQRDGNGLNFRALDLGVAITGLGSSAAGPVLDRFASLGIRAIPKFATDDLGLTNLYVVGHDEDGYTPPAPISLSACGEACHPDANEALDKALNEFAAARVRKAFSHGPQALVDAVAPPGYTSRFLEKARAWMVGSESRAFDEMRAWSRLDAPALRDILKPVYATRSTKAFADLPSTGAPDAYARGTIARERVEAEGFDVLYVDCSVPGGATAAVKVIVPGLEVETMSYHRLGARNAGRLIDRGNPLIKFGEATETLRPVRMPPDDAEALGTPLFDTALADAIVGSLYPLYREPEAHHVAWAEGQTG